MAYRKVDTGIVERNGSYRFTVALGMDVRGKQIRKTCTWKPAEPMTEKKADKLAKEQYIIFKKSCEGFTELDIQMRFVDLVKEYRTSYLPQLKDSTIRVYNSVIDNHLMEYFGNMRLKDITVIKINKFLNTHTQHNNQHEEMPLNNTLAKRIMITFSSIMHFAVSQNYIKSSPCDSKGIILPAKGTEIDDSENERDGKKYLTQEELPEFMKYFEGYSELNTIVKVLLYTGIRSGECIALSWSDIDFENRTIRIRKTLACLKGEYKLTTPKTKRSKRIIYMNDTLYNVLKEHRKHQFSKVAEMNQTELSDMVFTSPTGQYVNQPNLNAKMKKVLKGTKFEFMTLHCLRHTNATLLLNSGVDLKIVSSLLGHADVTTTADIYADVLETTKRRVADLIDFKIAQ